jgi:hypothetical protein
MNEVDIIEAAPVVDEAAPVVWSTAELQQEPVEQVQPEAKSERMFTQAELDEKIQKRLAKESRKAARIAEIETENRFLRQQAEERKQPQEQPQGKPTVERYETYEDYLDALSDWKVDQKLAGLKQDTSAQQQQREAAEFTQRRDAKLAEGAEKYDDFDEVVRDKSLQISPYMAAAATESDIGADLLYYLGTHRDEAARIAKLNPAAQFREMVKLEDKVKAPPKTTAAPPPITPSGQRATVTKDPSDMSFNEFSEWRRKVIAKRR